MNAQILLLIWVLPLVLAVLAAHRYARWIMLTAPLPALYAAAAVPVGTSVSLPWLLLGVELGLDETGRMFLLFSGLLWLAATLSAAGHRVNDRSAPRFRVFFLLAMSGNLGLIVAQDMLSFYLGFTLMGLAAYGLIAHPASLRARLAARRYLAWTIGGEMILFVAIVLLAQQHDGALAFELLKSSPPAGFVVLLLIIGFGIKLALPGLHLWLPRAYAVAPTPAVMVLSGAMIKAGLLGWLRFLPPGDAAMVGAGQALMIVGTAGIVFGAILGLLQQRPRMLLGYSSISKMGVLTAGMGAVLVWPTAAPTLIAALVIYAAHHALVKGALFLGLGLIERGGMRPWIWAGLGFLTLTLAGAPLTSGALAKSMLTTSLPDAANVLVSMLAVAAFATTLLMARLLFLVWRQRGSDASPHAAESTTAWLILLALIAVFPFAIADAGQPSTSILPLALGVLLAASVLLFTSRSTGRITHWNRPALARRLGLGFRHRLLWLTRVARTGGTIPRSMWLTQRESLRHGLHSLQWQPASKNSDLWPLTGSLWLGIGGLLLGALTVFF